MHFPKSLPKISYCRQTDYLYISLVKNTPSFYHGHWIKHFKLTKLTHFYRKKNPENAIERIEVSKNQSVAAMMIESAMTENTTIENMMIENMMIENMTTAKMIAVIEQNQPIMVTKDPTPHVIRVVIEHAMIKVASLN